jgi:threonine dehydrogenase-like Zn-dependent dehydrogenase
MRGAVLYGKGDVRLQERADPKITRPTDAIIRMSDTCVCGSDLWDYRGINPAVDGPTPIGHEYCGIVEEVGAQVTTIRPGQFVVGSFMACDNTCPICRTGWQSSCQHGEFVGANGAQAEALLVPLADGTLVATPEVPDTAMLPSLLAASDVLGTAGTPPSRPTSRPARSSRSSVTARSVCSVSSRPGTSVLSGSSRSAGMHLGGNWPSSSVPPTSSPERGDDAVARIQDLTGGLGADSVLECVGTPEAMDQALRSTRPGGNVGFVGVPHGVQIDGQQLFYSHAGLRGGPAPVRRFLPDLIRLITAGEIDPGRVFDLTLPLDQVAEGYRAMDERRAIKTLLIP